MIKESKILKIGLLLIILTGFQNTLSAQNFTPELRQLIKKATERNHDLAVNKYKITASKIDRSMAYKTFLPKISLQANYTHLNDEIVLDPKLQLLLKGTEKLLIKEQLGIPFNSPLPPNIPTSQIAPLSPQNILKSSADLDWVLFTGLEARFGIKATRHKEKALQLQNKIITKKLVKEVVNTYDQLALLIASEKVLAATNEQLSIQKKYVQAAVKNGLAISIDFQRIALAGQQLQIKQTEVANNKALVVAKLAQLTGENPKLIRQLKPKLSVWVLPENISDKDKQATEIAALKEAEKAVNYLEKKQYGKYLPKIAVKGHYEFIDNDLSLLDPKWYIGIGVKWQIFDGLHAYDKARKYKLIQQEYQEKIQKAGELIQLAETKSQLDLKYAQQQIILHQQAADLAQNTYKMLQKQYQNGLVNITEVLKALTDWQKARFELQKAILSQRNAAIELLYRKDLLSVSLENN